MSFRNIMFYPNGKVDVQEHRSNPYHHTIFSGGKLKLPKGYDSSKEVDERLDPEKTSYTFIHTTTTTEGVYILLLQEFESEIEKNYSNFLKKPSAVGCDRFPEVAEITDTIEVKDKCKNFDVNFKVYLGKVVFEWKEGKETKKINLDAVWTDRVRIAHKLFAEGWGSYCFVDEGQTMDRGIVEMCKKHNLMICDKVNSWPTAKAIVQPNNYK